MDDGTLFPLAATDNAVVVLLVWGATPSLANRTGTTVEVVVASCHNRSSKLCWNCGQCSLRSLPQKAADQELCLPLAKRFCALVPMLKL